MRYLLILLTLLSFPALADRYTVPRDTSVLLTDALQPLTESSRFTKFTALKYLRYRLANDAGLMRPHLAELEALYKDPILINEPKSSVAAVLLVLGSSLDKTDLRLNALRHSRTEDSPALISSSGLLQALASETPASEANVVLDALFEHDQPLKWYNNRAQLSSFVDTTARLLPASTKQQNHLTNLVRTRMKLAQRFEQDKIEEAKFSGMITIWDHSTDADITELLGRFDKAICSITPDATTKEWRYTFIDKANMTETGAVRDLVCQQ